MTPTVEVRFEMGLYAADVLERAAYRFSDRFSFELVSNGDLWSARLHFIRPIEDAAQEQAVHEFRKEALDQKLRAVIRAETSATRNLILARAFSRSGLSLEP